MKINTREYQEKDLEVLVSIWNEVVKAGNSFPQENELTLEDAKQFFAQQTYVGVAIDTLNDIKLGLYILHPNNVGRCSHIANASFAVSSKWRGHGFGETLVRDCLVKAKEFGFKVLQFNAVVETNTGARKLYSKMGFTQLGVIPNGFRLKNGEYVNICPYYIEL
ncbi:MAG: GNAT family N-acetyltransferase [Clostridia bacterium]|nr:GNAT family N-acetyltransferase [Clostridia bacterium]